MKKSFYLFNDLLTVLDELTMEQRGELFTAIRDYNLGKEPEIKGLMKAIFLPFRLQFDRDHESYLEKVEVNRINGSKGGRKPKETQSV